MVTKRVPTVSQKDLAEFNDQTIEAHYENLATEPEFERDEYVDLFAGLGDSDDEKVLLYRIVPGSQKQGLLCRLEPGSSVEDIQPRFGGGDYIIKRLRFGAVAKSARLYIEGEPKMEKPPVENHPAPQQSFDMNTFMAGMQESNRQLMLGMAQIFKPPVQQSRADFLAEMASMKNLLGDNRSPVDQTDMLLKGIELAKSFTPREGDVGGMEVLTEAIRSFAPAINHMVRSAQPPAAKPAQVKALAAPAIPEVNQLENDDMLFKYYLGMLVNFATEGRDPVLYADLILDNLPESKVIELLEKPDTIAYLITVDAGVANNRAWFETVISEMRSAMGLTSPEIESSVIKIEPETNNDSGGN